MRALLSPRASPSGVVLAVGCRCVTTAVVGALTAPISAWDNRYIVLAIVAGANCATASVRISTRIVSALSHVKEKVVSLVFAHHKIGVCVIRRARVDMMNYRLRRQRVAECRLDHKNVLEDIPPSDGAGVCLAEHADISVCVPAPATPVVRLRALVVSMVVQEAVVVAALYAAIQAIARTLLCCFSATALTQARWIKRHANNIADGAAAVPAVSVGASFRVIGSFALTVRGDHRIAPLESNRSRGYAGISYTF